MIYTKEVKQVHESYDRIPERGVCDVCGKELESLENDNYDYYRITTHHHNWGNDSIESYEYFDVCSIYCLREFVGKFWRINRDEINGIPGHDTYEMNIEHEFSLEKHPDW